jgi:hypothetical protein
MNQVGRRTGARGGRHERRSARQLVIAGGLAVVLLLAGAAEPATQGLEPGQTGTSAASLTSPPASSSAQGGSETGTDAGTEVDDGGPNDGGRNDGARSDEVRSDEGLDDEALSVLPTPTLDGILPETLPVAEGVTGSAATPVAELTAGYDAPGGRAVIALEAQALGTEARWAVTAVRDGWVQVMVPYGRGALASVDPARTNHRAVWVRAEDVVVTGAQTLTLDVAARTLTVGGWTVSVGVGKESTPTPTGLCAVVGRVYDPSVGDALLTSCQSESMDEYYEGTGYAVVALHADPEGGAAVGQARSNGCLRMDAAEFQALLDRVTPGDILVIVG